MIKKILNYSTWLEIIINIINNRNQKEYKIFLDFDDIFHVIFAGYLSESIYYQYVCFHVVIVGVTAR